jgi:zinc and cadmium transporter
MALYAFLAVAVVSLVSLVGVFTLSIDEQRLKKNIFILVSLAIGAMLGDAFIHIIPEAFESSLGSTTTSILVIVGILIFFIVEKFLHWHHHGEDAHLDHIHPVGKLVIFSDGIHNFIDGVIIGASFIVSIPVGIATTIAVVLHEIPQEIGDFGVLLHAGYTKKRALWLNFISGLLAVAGVAVALALGSASENFALWILPLAAGGFIYIAVADLIPELQKSKSARQSIYQILAIGIGVLAMVALVILE